MLEIGKELFNFYVVLKLMRNTIIKNNVVIKNSLLRKKCHYSVITHLLERLRFWI